MNHGITDIGEGADFPGGRICRYGVWVVLKGVADHVIEMSDDLKELKENYPEARVVELRPNWTGSSAWRNLKKEKGGKE